MSRGWESLFPVRSQSFWWRVLSFLLAVMAPSWAGWRGSCYGYAVVRMTCWWGVFCCWIDHFVCLTRGSSRYRMSYESSCLDHHFLGHFAGTFGVGSPTFLYLLISWKWGCFSISQVEGLPRHHAPNSFQKNWTYCSNLHIYYRSSNCFTSATIDPYFCPLY